MKNGIVKEFYLVIVQFMYLFYTSLVSFLCLSVCLSFRLSVIIVTSH